MKISFRSLFSILLAVMLIFTQLSFTLAEENGARLEILELKSEYYYRDPFSAKLRYYPADGEDYEDISAIECDISGFNNLAELPETQEITIQYRDASVTCTVQAGYNRQDMGKYNWGFNEKTGELVICATGTIDMASPWLEYAADIRTITIMGRYAGISASTFKQCTNVETINIEANISTIPSYTFYQCKKVKNIFLPNTLKNLSKDSFYIDSHNDTNVFYFGGQENWDMNVQNEYDVFSEAHLYTDCDQFAEFYIQNEYQLSDEFYCELRLFEIYNLYFEKELLTVQGFDSSIPGKQMVTVSFGPFSETEIVNITDPDAPDDDEIVIEHIYTENVKTEYEYGEDFYIDVYVCYSDGRTEQVIDYLVEGFDSFTPGEQKVTVIYGDYTEVFDIVVYGNEAISNPSGSCGENLTWEFVEKDNLLIISGEGDMDENFYAPWKEYKDSVYEIVVTEGVINLSTYAFIHHTHLKKVTLPEGLKTIGVYAFDNCPELTEINFPDTLEVIGEFAFCGDQLLSSVILPESLTELASYAFKDCLNLSEIYFKGSIEQWADIDKGGLWDHNAGSSTAKGTYSLYCDRGSQEIYIGAKTTYTVGDGFQAEVYVLSDDGTYRLENYTFEGYDSTKTGPQTVTVYYGNYSKTFEIIVEKEVIEGNILQVRFDYIKENYEYGEDFYAEITVETDVNIYHNVSDYVVEGFDSYHPGEQRVTVMYGEYSRTVTVWVNEPEPTPEPEPDPEPELTFTVSIENVQTEYEYGENFYAEVWLHYSDGISAIVSDFLVEGFDSYTPGKQRVNIIYGDYSENFVVTVHEENIPDPEKSPVISVSNVNAMPGDTVDVVVSISDNTGFSNLGLEIEYSDALKLINVSENIDVDAQFTPAQTLDVYPFNFSFDNEAGSAFNGDLVTLTFEVAEDAQAGEHFVNVNYYDGRDDNYIDGEDVNYDVDENPLNLCYEDGFVCVYTHIPGDIDGNGVVNNLDATYLLRYLSGWNMEYINELALDTTGDGRINNKDGTRLLRYLANWNVDIH